MDRYQRVEKPREESPLGPNEVRITAQGRPRNYITYALALLQDNGTDEIVIKAMGRAINKTIIIVELLKRRIAGLHQNTSIESLDITDTWEPLEEGLVTLETTRHVSLITIKLSKKELDTLSPGYQPPIPADQVRPVNDLGEDADAVPSAGPVNDLGEDADAVPSGGPVPSGRGRGRGRGGRSRERGYNNGGADYGPDQVRPANDLSDDADAVPSGGAVPSGRGRGRGRGGRSRERGYNNGGADYDDENGYPQEAPRGYRGRGRGRGRRGPGRGYGGNGYAMEEAGGYNDVEYYNAPPVQGHDGGRGRGRGRGRGGRGRGPPP